MQIKPSLQDIIPYSAGKNLPGKLKLSSNENPLGPCPSAIKAMEDVLAGVHRYPDGASTQLRDKIADKLNLKRDWVAVGNGSDELLALICGALIDKGSEGIIAENTFSEYRFSIKLFSGTPIAVPLKDGCFDLQAMAAAVTDQTRLIFLCNPNNPTGTYRNHRDIARFLESIPDHVVVLLDEAYQDYTDAEDYPDALDLVRRFPRLLVTRTFSKIYGLAGLRLGYGFAQPEVIDLMLRAKQAFNVNLLSQTAGAAALEDKNFHDRSRSMTLEGKTYLYKELDRLGITYYPTQGNFICITLNRPAEEVYQAILDRGIIIRSLTSFGLDKSIRYTISNSEDNRRFIEYLEDLRGQNLC